MSKNATPQTLRPALVKGRVALDGITQVGALVGIKANDAPTFGGDYYDLFGRHGDPTATPPIAAIVGKEPLYLERKAQHAAARAAHKIAVADGLTFAAKAIDNLRGSLGRRWNARWTAVGFATPSLKLPRDPIPTLLLLEAHYRAHTENEVATIDLTGAKTSQVLDAIDAARRAMNQARDREKAAKDDRDASFERFRVRIAALRNELTTLLSANDSRWYEFGFRRPIDGETPDMVEVVSLRIGAAGEVIVEWPKARLAVNYRVAWKVTGSAGDPTLVGLVTDPQAVITGLPHPANITVIVTARNAAGESVPMQAAIALA